MRPLIVEVSASPTPEGLVVFDHRLEKPWIVSTGLQVDGSRDEAFARRQAQFWQSKLTEASKEMASTGNTQRAPRNPIHLTSNLSRAEFAGLVAQAQRY